MTDINEFEPHTTYSDNGEEFALKRIIDRILRKKEPGFYVDIGAYHPIESSLTYFLYKRGWRGICVDVLSDIEEEFHKYRPNDTFIKCIVSDQDQDESEIFLSDGQTNSIIYNEKKHNQSIKLRSYTLNTLLETYCNRKIDYLNIDIEGAEYSCLNDFSFSKYSPTILSVEHHSKARDITNGIQSPVVKLVLQNGYKLISVNTITYIFLKND